MIQLNFKRYEIKYLLDDQKRDSLQKLMERHMVPDEWGPSTVCNVYYDTPTHLLVRRSVEHPLYKEKVRVRSYGSASSDKPVFVELKKKYDGVVYKRRCTMNMARANELLATHGNPSGQIERELDYTAKHYGGLVPSMFIAYDREAFYDPNDHEFRMTFDRRVRCREHDLRLDAGDEGEQYLEDGRSILEVKAGGAVPLWLVRFLSEEGLYRTHFSKIGVAWNRKLERARRNVRTVVPQQQSNRAWSPVPAFA